LRDEELLGSSRLETNRLSQVNLVIFIVKQEAASFLVRRLQEFIFQEVLVQVPIVGLGRLDLLQLSFGEVVVLVPLDYFIKELVVRVFSFRVRLSSYHLVNIHIINSPENIEILVKLLGLILFH
jgi:hypothetical protein